MHANVTMYCKLVLATLICVMQPASAEELEVKGQIVTGPAGSSLQASVWVEGPTEMALAVSADDGGTFHIYALTMPPRCGKVSNPVVAIDLKQRIHIAFAGQAASGYLASAGGIFVITTEDLGKTFLAARQLGFNGSNTTSMTPYMTCDADDQSPYRNHVYVVWIQATTAADGSEMTQVMFTKSRNGGSSFYVSPPDGLDGGVNFYLSAIRINFGLEAVSSPAINAGDWRNLHVGWLKEEIVSARGNQIRVGRTSHNGGISFGREEKEQ